MKTPFRSVDISLVILALTLTTACSSADDDDDATVDSAGLTPSPSPTPSCVDADHDSVCAQDDCDDTDPSRYPGAVEVCGDNFDQDCDGYDGCNIDNDGDGFSEDAGDCNDANGTQYPGADELCANGVDENCDGTVDNLCPNIDDDGDGYCEAATCSDGSLPGDCDDGDPRSHPGSLEAFDGVDNDCDGAAEDRLVWLSPEQTLNYAGTSALQRVGISLGATRVTGARRSFNADVYSDLIVGMTGAGGLDTGAAAVFLGGTEWHAGLLEPPSAPLVLSHGQEGAHAGFSVLGGFDLDDDGIGDLSVGAPYEDVSSSAEDAGTDYVFYGSSVVYSSSMEAAQTWISGYFDDVKIGYSTSAGDVNGDGIDDLIMGCPSDESWLFVLLGGSDVSGKIEGSDLWRLGDSDEGFLGQAVAFVGDSDADGYGDFIAGARGDDEAGRIAWIPGGTAFNSSAINWGIEQGDATLILGESAGDNLGWSLAGGGDIDGDGAWDFGAAFESIPSGGTTLGFIFYGGESLFQGNPPDFGPYDASDAAGIELVGADGDACPCSIAIGGDVNADGFSDILIGVSAAQTETEDAGRVYLVLGRSEMPSRLMLDTDADYILNGAVAGEAVGYAVAWAGDVNGDGLGDFMVGAPGADLDMETPDAGRVYMLFGY